MIKFAFFHRKAEGQRQGQMRRLGNLQVRELHQIDGVLAVDDVIVIRDVPVGTIPINPNLNAIHGRFAAGLGMPAVVFGGRVLK